MEVDAYLVGGVCFYHQCNVANKVCGKCFAFSQSAPLFSPIVWLPFHQVADRIPVNCVYYELRVLVLNDEVSNGCMRRQQCCSRRSFSC